MKSYIDKCVEGIDLTEAESAAALELIMTNQATDVQIAGLLVALRAKGETVDEIVGFARTMREHAVKLPLPAPDAIDMCGTGGDGLGTFNISTVSSFVVAGAGVVVAKHGNRSVSSRAGSADLLVALGVDVNLPPERVGKCLERVGIGFLFAPLFHPAMKFAGKTRAELGVRTIFNMLGPITNPAGVRRQLIGTYRTDVAGKLSAALARLNTEHACVVHSQDGMDEVSLSGSTDVFEVDGSGGSKHYKVSADVFGLTRSPLESVTGGNAGHNAGIARRVLGGEKGPARDVVLANAAFGIYVAGGARELREARAKSEESIDSGRAMKKLRELVEFTTAQ